MGKYSGQVAAVSTASSGRMGGRVTIGGIVRRKRLGEEVAHVGKELGLVTVMLAASSPTRSAQLASAALSGTR